MLLYLAIGGIALYWLFFAGGKEQVSGMIDNIKGSIGGSSPVVSGDSGISVGTGGVKVGGSGISVSPSTGIDVAGIHVGTDGIRVPGINMPAFGQSSGINKKIQRNINNTGNTGVNQTIDQHQNSVIRTNSSNMGFISYF